MIKDWSLASTQTHGASSLLVEHEQVVAAAGVEGFVARPRAPLPSAIRRRLLRRARIVRLLLDCDLAQRSWG